MLTKNRKVYIHNPYEIPNYDAINLNKEQYNLFKKQYEINQNQKYLIEVTCDGTWQGIQEAITRTESNIVQTFMTYQETNLYAKNEMMKNWVTLKEGIPNIENDELIQAKLLLLQKIKRIIEEIQHAHTIGSKVYVLHIGSKSYRDLKPVPEEEQIKDNLEAILSQTKNTDIMILLENSAANKCHGVQIENLLKIKRKCVKLCFDMQHYFAAGSGRYPDNYKQVIDKYEDEIHLLHINNVMKERKIKQKDRFVKKIKATIFGSGQDVHALLLQGQLS
ncbi:36923_t:CDS:2 [Racocetra persica]|uniref:36923_t:CDS:1 n=1 Tax=Racocetra persica TaxID=160502 RepID=A0ACA9RSD3_9GLOM|nr:36923_t:CDS:2 [Racocetra persica]